MNQKGFISGPLLIIGLIFLGLLGIYLSQSSKPKEVSPDTKAIVNHDYPFPTSMPTSTPAVGTNFDPLTYALRSAETLEDLSLCGQKLTSVPKELKQFKKLRYLDLSENGFSTFEQVKSLRDLYVSELNLVRNNFSEEEQQKILDYFGGYGIKIALTPQKNFNPYLTDSWKNYINSTYGFSFKYHPELSVEESKRGVWIKSDLVDFKQAFASCAIESGFVDMFITVEDNPENLTPDQYISKIWRVALVKKGNEYLPANAGEAMGSMFQFAKDYKNGDLEGIVADAGESQHPRIIVARNGKIFILQYLTGGQTGSGIGEVATQTLEQTLATFKFK